MTRKFVYIYIHFLSIFKLRNYIVNWITMNRKSGVSPVRSTDVTCKTHSG